MKNKTRYIAFLGVISAVAMVLSVVEMLIPPIWSAVPGIKIGLPNIIILFLLYKTSFKEALSVSLIRIFTVSLLFGTALTLCYSLVGGILSLAVMWLLKKSGKFSPVGVSIVGGVTHNFGQIITAVIILSTKEIGFYFPVLAVTGTLAGIFVGLLGILLLKYTEKIKL